MLSRVWHVLFADENVERLLEAGARYQKPLLSGELLGQSAGVTRGTGGMEGREATQAVRVKMADHHTFHFRAELIPDPANERFRHGVIDGSVDDQGFSIGNENKPVDGFSLGCAFPSASRFFLEVDKVGFELTFGTEIREKTGGYLDANNRNRRFSTSVC